MKSIKTIFSLLFILSLVSLSSCKKDKKTEESNTSNAKMELIKDGVKHNITSFNNSLMNETQNGHSGRRMDLRCNVDGGTFVLSLSNWDWQNPPANGVLIKSYDTDESGTNTKCKDVSGDQLCDGGLGTYLVGSTNYYSTGDNDSAGVITITKNDTQNKTVSGSFEFAATDIFTKADIKFSGTFSDLNYKTN